MALLAELCLSPHGIEIMGTELVVSQVVESYQRKIEQRKRLKETVIREYREVLSRCPDEEIRRRIIEQIPELA